MLDRRNETNNTANRNLHIDKMFIQIAAMLSFSLLQVMAISRKVLQITTNPKQIQPNKMNKSNEPEETVISKHMSPLIAATCVLQKAMYLKTKYRTK